MSKFVLHRAGLRSAWLVSAALVLPAAPVWAASDLSSLQTEIEEIIVSATKRDTRLQVTPLAITALSGADLDKLDARDFEDYFRRVPGLAVLDNGAGRKRYLLRGVSSINANGTQAVVAQYLDEIPLTDNFDAQPDPRLIDVERVEVLRGPQGTLWGARAMAGTVRTITRKPVLDRVEGNATATFSDTRFGGLNANIEGVLNTPLNDTTALRLAAFYSKDEGYVDNVFPGGRFVATPQQVPPGIPVPPPVTLAPIYKPNFSDVSFFGGRAALRWVPSDRLTLDIMGMVQKGIINGVPVYNVGLTGNEANGLIAAVVGDTGNKDKLYLGTAVATYTMDWADLTAVAAYAKRDNAVLGAAQAGGPLLGSGPGGTESFGSDTKGLTFEARLTSKLDGPFQYFIGGYAFTQTRDGRQQRFLGFAQVVESSSTFHSVTSERALFGEATYTPIDPLTFTVGVRYSDYRNRLERFFIIPPPMVAAGPDPNIPRFAEDAATFKIGADYRLSPDVMVYALASQGFRPGGFNGNAIPGYNLVPNQFQSDSLWNYEIGAKTQFLDRRLTLNGAVYRIDWSDMQVQGFAPSPSGGPMPIIFTTNATTSQIYGLEIEASARVTESLSLDFSFNHFFKNELTQDGPRGNTGLTPRRGDPLSYNPETSFLIGAEYRRPITPGLSGSARIDYTYTGRRFSGFHALLDNGAPNNLFNDYKGYSLVNLRAGVNARVWRAAVFVDNVFDERPVMQQQNYAPVPVTTRVTSRPRTYGATLSRSF